MRVLIKKISVQIKKKGLFFILKKGIGQLFYVIFSSIYKFFLNYADVQKKVIVFVSEPDFSDNSYTLYQYMSTDPVFSEYQFKWLVKDPSKFKNHKKKNTDFVPIGSQWHTRWSLAAMKVCMTSEYIFFSHVSPLKWLKKKDSQLVINLWHGCGYKSMKSTNNWLKNNPCDYSLVPGSVFIETKSVFWSCPKERIIPIGYPRYDEFRHASEHTKKLISEMKRNAKKLIMWMPTYRKTELEEFAVNKIDGFFELPIMRSYEDIKNLNEICKKRNVVICIKRHPLQIRYKCEELELSNILFIDNLFLSEHKATLYELLGCVDGLITDYSSVAIDYILLDKPIAFTLDDFKEYGNAQGFVFDDPLKYMPGNHIYKYDDLIDFITETVNEIDKHKEDRKNIMNEVHNPCDNYCKRICDTLFSKTVEQIHKDGIEGDVIG